MPPATSDDESSPYDTRSTTEEHAMYEMFDANFDAMTAEQAYRRSRLIGTRSLQPLPRGRWRRRRTERAD
jgi:hypothetical protein